MSLLTEIQDAAIDATSDLPTLLRRSKLLASRIKYVPLSNWVDFELNGYAQNDEVPSYRRFSAVFLADFLGRGFHSKNKVIDPSYFEDYEFAKEALNVSNYESIGELAGLLSSGDSDFYSPVPAGVPSLLDGRVFAGMACVSLKIVIPRAKVAKIFDSVRNALLSFTIDLEGMFPELSERDRVVVSERIIDVDRAFNLRIEGSGNAVTVDSPFSRQR